MVYIPVKSLLKDRHYRRFELSLGGPQSESLSAEKLVLPCVVHETETSTEYLRGATYRINMLPTTSHV